MRFMTESAPISPFPEGFQFKSNSETCFIPLMFKSPSSPFYIVNIAYSKSGSCQVCVSLRVRYTSTRYQNILVHYKCFICHATLFSSQHVTQLIASATFQNSASKPYSGEERQSCHRLRRQRIHVAQCYVEELQTYCSIL